MTRIYVSKGSITGSDNGLLLGRCQAIIWTNAGISIIEPLGTNFSEILIWCVKMNKINAADDNHASINVYHDVWWQTLMTCILWIEEIFEVIVWYELNKYFQAQKSADHFIYKIHPRSCICLIFLILLWPGCLMAVFVFVAGSNGAQHCGICTA